MYGLSTRLAQRWPSAHDDCRPVGRVKRYNGIVVASSWPSAHDDCCPVGRVKRCNGKRRNKAMTLEQSKRVATCRLQPINEPENFVFDVA